MKTASAILSLTALLLTPSPLRADDRPLFVVAGPVSSITIVNDDGEMSWEQTFEFDTDGLLTAIDGQEPRIERDTLGRPVKISLDEEDEDGETVTVDYLLTYVGTTFSVSEARTEGADPEGNWTYTYRYDPHTGRALSRTYADPQEPETFVFAYTAADADGNWTERTETPDGAEFPVTQRRILSR